jgi:hypothetical protein
MSSYFKGGLHTHAQMLTHTHTHTHIHTHNVPHRTMSSADKEGWAKMGILMCTHSLLLMYTHSHQKLAQV